MRNKNSIVLAGVQIWIDVTFLLLAIIVERVFGIQLTVLIHYLAVHMALTPGRLWLQHIANRM